MIAVLIAIESTRGTLISATLAVGEKSCRRASSLRELLLWNVSTTNATEYFVAISEVSGLPCSPPRAHGGSTGKNAPKSSDIEKNPDVQALAPTKYSIMVLGILDTPNTCSE